MNAIKYKLVEVEWNDSTSLGHHTAWAPLSQFISEAEDVVFTARSVGYVVHEDEYSIALAASLTFPNGEDEDAGEVSGTMIIPRCCIVELREC